MKADDNGDTLTLMFESEKQERISDFDLKLMSIESEQLGIPDQDYSAEVKMPSSEYQRICRDLASIGDTVLISATKEGVKFSTTGDVGTANVTLRCGIMRAKAVCSPPNALRRPLSCAQLLECLTLQAPKFPTVACCGREACCTQFDCYSSTRRHTQTAEKPEEQTIIELHDPVALTFALRYLNNFAKVSSAAS